MAKIIALAADGTFQEVQPISVSAGVGDANKVMQTDSTGKLDISLMPTGIGADTQSIISSEPLLAGDFVNIYNNAGTRTCRKANALDATKPAHGFVLNAFGNGAVALVYVRGLNTLVPTASMSVGDVGKFAYLSSSTSGTASPIRPVSTGNIVQPVGTIVLVNGGLTTINFSQSSYTNLI